MADWYQIDWGQLLSPSGLLEIILRGTAVYITLFLILRFIPNRQIGAVGLTDLLLVVLLANAVQNAMAADYKSITDGLILVGTVAFWSYALNWLGYRFPRFQRLLRPTPLPLVQEGKLVQENMEQQLLTEEELESRLRMQGLEKVEEVKEAHMEADGRISVVPKDKTKGGAPSDDKPLGAN